MVGDKPIMHVRRACASQSIKTHGHAPVAKRVVWCTSVLITGTINSLFSTPRISIATGPISIKFTYFMPFIYATLHTKFEKIGPVVHKKCVSENYPIFFTFFLFFTPFYKSNFEPTENILFMDHFLSNLTHLLGTLWPILA